MNQAKTWGVKSLAFKIPVLFLLMLLLMSGAFLLVMENFGKPLLISESERHLRQSGQAMVSTLSERLSLTASLVTSMAKVAQNLPQKDTLHHDLFPNMIAIEGTEHFIAGGGIWPEPKHYQKHVERHSFFWGRDGDNNLEYFDDYNDPKGPGYHNEEWYVPARHLKAGQVYWSRSYMDPYSFQSMVTATAPMFRNGQFYGVATVDIKLEGLQELLAKEAKKNGGYAYALDRDGTFLSFPDSKVSQSTILNVDGKEEVRPLSIDESTKEVEHFAYLIQSLKQLNKVSSLNGFLLNQAQDLASDSYQIDLKQSMRIMHVLQDPFKEREGGLLLEFRVSEDPILNEPVFVHVFHVPGAYFNVVTVTPDSTVFSNSEYITQAVLHGFVAVSILSLLLGFLYLHRVLLTPLNMMKNQVADSENHTGFIQHVHHGELGDLARQFNQRTLILSKTNERLSDSIKSAEQASEAKAQFLANMSHEIRTPMNGVLGMLDLLLDADLDTQQQHFAEVAQTSAEGLLVLINDILDFSKIEAGKLEIEKIDFDLFKLLADLSASMAHLAQKKKLELILDMNDLENIWVRGDPSRIRQIFTNLISNAIKFSTHGHVLIKVGLKDASGMGELLYASVQDTGIGIEKHKLEHLFESFSQADSSTTRQFGGTGLGLSIAKQLCELMHGSISVSSKVNEGSNFSFSVCLQLSKNKRLMPTPLDLTGIRILLVDDCNEALSVLKTLLQKWGASIEVYQDGQRLIADLIDQNEQSRLLANHVAIIDRNMPDVSGQDMALAIQQKSDMGIILLDQVEQPNDDIEYKHKVYHLKKPVIPQNLHRALFECLNPKGLLKNAPAFMVEKEVQQSLKQNQPTNRRKQLLLVEDNAINQEVAMQLLSDLGYEVDMAEHGQQALDILNEPRAKQYDAILMDCQMPVLDGYETTRIIRKSLGEKINSNVPIIAVTANAMKGDREKCIKAGMDDYMSKPLGLHDLKEMLEKWLG